MRVVQDNTRWMIGGLVAVGHRTGSMFFRVKYDISAVVARTISSTPVQTQEVSDQ